jgi:hypothetical protein
MADRASIEVAPTRRPGSPSRVVCLSLILALSGAAGCGESGTVSVSKSTRAKLSSDADADGNVVLPKTKNPRRPAAGLKTARGLLNKDD